MEVLVVKPQLKVTFPFLFAVCLLIIFAQAKDVKYCDKKGNYDVKVHGVDIVPDPIATGKPATFNITASTGQTITGGKVILEVSYLGVRVDKETHDLCEETSCPISSGKFVLSHTQTLPAFTPPGPYKLKMKMEDENNHELTCISFGFKIGLGSSVSSI